MTKILPASGTFPGPNPYATLEPALDHYTREVEGLVEGQHYCCAYIHRSHAGQLFGASTDLSIGLCRSISVGSFTLVLEYLIQPRRHVTDLRFRWRILSDGGGTVQITILETAQTISVASIGGTLNAAAALLATGRSDLLTTIAVELDVADGGTYAELLAFSIGDLDIALGSMP